ncbi:hypothetical protein FOMPIDRAFT_1125266 [Fomitopsis schrenkii]|uniref:Peptidase S1 domain-containing protein n=1 Tax=Fomitopsis schrenkii TaxID=2126942 RepID=S8E2D7_FOMSC|nr:hypothetical protein FOMPIDRAFT_1125266 [Fomitopsis schrenkii]
MSQRRTILAAAPSVPQLPSKTEATFFYYGLPSKPILVARSSTYLWVEPKGLEAYLDPKVLNPVGPHLLNQQWESVLATNVERYLRDKGVAWTSIDPIRIGYVGDPSPPVIVWVGVIPGSLSAADGLEVARACRAFLIDLALHDVHVEIRESEAVLTAKMKKPTATANPVHRAQEPFASSVGIPISPSDTRTIEGTAGLFFTDPSKPGKIFLLTARHVLFHPQNEPNECYVYPFRSSKRRSVLLLGDDAFDRQIFAIKKEITHHQGSIGHLSEDLASEIDSDDPYAEDERKRKSDELKASQQAQVALEPFLTEIIRDWTDPSHRVIGHVILSPPLSFGLGPDRFTEDWAVIEVDSRKVDKSNFICNAIDLGTEIPKEDFNAMMHPHPANPPSFRFPGDRLLRFHGTIPDNEMISPNPATCDQDGNPVIMVIKRGATSGVTIGRLNNIRSVVRYNVQSKCEESSREVSVMPQFSKRSIPFSERGDSGSVIIDGKGRVAGLLNGGSGIADSLDITYITSINFLIRRMAEHGYNAHIFPTAADL